MQTQSETRQILLKAAFNEIWRKGFRSASLENILQHTNLTKGALYHHFKNKNELGYAVVDELIRKKFEENWIAPLKDHDNPIDAIQLMLKNYINNMPEDAPILGCPLNNLAQEMSPIDEGFRQKIEAVFIANRNAIAEALASGQKKILIRQDINPAEAALFITSSFEGSYGAMKNCKDKNIMLVFMKYLSIFLDSLRI